MIELEYQYWNELAKQMILISALLSGFSFTALITMVDSKDNSSAHFKIFMASAIAATCFLVCIFGMTKILMMTSPGFPFKIEDSDFMLPRTIGMACFVGGVISLLTIIAQSGWVKSKNAGRITTAFSIIAFILFVLLTS